MVEKERSAELLAPGKKVAPTPKMNFSFKSKLYPRLRFAVGPFTLLAELVLENLHEPHRAGEVVVPD
jgi:hypothetical protein